MKRQVCGALFAAHLLTFIVPAQTGGNFNLTSSVIASGGGSNSTGGGFKLAGVVGQPAAGTISTGGNLSLRGGFWEFPTLSPTAARVFVSGRATTADGQGIRNARITLTDARGAIRATKTAAFGYYRFDEVEVGQIYILEISSKKFVFASPTHVLNVQEDILNADFIALP